MISDRIRPEELGLGAHDDSFSSRREPTDGADAGLEERGRGALIFGRLHLPPEEAADGVDQY